MEELSGVAWSPPGRFLLRRADELLLAIGPGTALRPGVQPAVPAASEWLRDAVEAMAWVAEERGLGGARSLDGLAWDLSIDCVWEAWIAAFARRLGGRLGMTASPFAGARVARCAGLARFSHDFPCTGRGIVRRRARGVDRCQVQAAHSIARPPWMIGRF